MILTQQNKISYYAIPGLKNKPKILNKYDHDLILEYLYDYFKTNYAEIAGDSLKRNICYKRNVIFYFLYNLSKLSFEKIGRQFNRHHTSIMNSVYKVSYNTKYSDDIKCIEKSIKQ